MASMMWVCPLATSNLALKNQRITLSMIKDRAAQYNHYAATCLNPLLKDRNFITILKGVKQNYVTHMKVLSCKSTSLLEIKKQYHGRR